MRLVCIILLQSCFALELIYGSCSGMFGASNPTIWKTIKEMHPDAFIWLGDVIYADIMIFPLVFRVPTEDLWRSKYIEAKKAEGYSDLINSTRILGIWDDHDYGNNNENRFFPHKELSKKLFLEFLDEPSDSIRYQREGIYISYDYFVGNIKVKVILLDDRTYMDAWCPEGDTLGEIQWEWLQNELQTETDLFLIMNGIQVNVEDRISITEKWHEHSRKRLLDLLQKYSNSILITGDVHYAEILEVSCYGFPLIELTTSGLTHSIETTYGFLSKIFISLWYPYTYNNGPRIYIRNFGGIKINADGFIEMNIYDMYGRSLANLRTSVDELKHKKIQPDYQCSISVGERQIKHLASVFFVLLLPIGIWVQLALLLLRKYSHSY